MLHIMRRYVCVYCNTHLHSHIRNFETIYSFKLLLIKQCILLFNKNCLLLLVIYNTYMPLSVCACICCECVIYATFVAKQNVMRAFKINFRKITLSFCNIKINNLITVTNHLQLKL